jgi:hypothetical protein
LSSRREFAQVEYFSVVMAGLVPAIYVLVSARKKDVDARLKAGHDEHHQESRRVILPGICPW